MNRRTFFGAAASGLAAVSLGRWGACREEAAAAMTDSLRMYVGTYTRDGSEGIYQATMDTRTGEFALIGVTKDVANPSFLALDPLHRFLYAVNEVGEFQGESTGSVTAFSIDPTSGTLRQINMQPSMGAAPAHLTVDRTGRFVLVANYGGGNVSVLPVREDGGLDAAGQVVQHTGSGADPNRQGAPHAHSVNLSPDNRFALVADLGIDRVMIYRFDDESGALTPASVPYAKVRPGSGPRHLSFGPGGSRLYAINELDSTITAFEYASESGRLREIQTVTTLPEGFAGRSFCADVHVSPDGRFVYGSNRGHDSIAVFRIDPERGSLTLVQHQSTGGRTPRNFAIDPSGRFLLAANQETRSVVSFRIDSGAGMLTPTGHQLDVPVPVCIVFAS